MSYKVHEEFVWNAWCCCGDKNIKNSKRYDEDLKCSYLIHICKTNIIYIINIFNLPKQPYFPQPGFDPLPVCWLAGMVIPNHWASRTHKKLNTKPCQSIVCQAVHFFGEYFCRHILLCAALCASKSADWQPYGDEHFSAHCFQSNL